MVGVVVSETSNETAIGNTQRNGELPKQPSNNSSHQQQGDEDRHQRVLIESTVTQSRMPP